MAKNPPDYQLDEEEQEIIEAFHQGKLVSTNEDLTPFIEAAKNSDKKTHRINFRVTKRDFEGIQIKSKQEGIPYQTLMSSILHKYLSGQLKEVD